MKYRCAECTLLRVDREGATCGECLLNRPLLDLFAQNQQVCPPGYFQVWDSGTIPVSHADMVKYLESLMSLGEIQGERSRHRLFDEATPDNSTAPR